MSETRKRLDGLRMLSNEKLDALAQHHGIKSHRHKPNTLIVPKCPWVILDKGDISQLWYGFFPTKRDAIITACMALKIDAADHTDKHGSSSP
jgi:hypothetical protein